MMNIRKQSWALFSLRQSKWAVVMWYCDRRVNTLHMRLSGCSNNPTVFVLFSLYINWNFSNCVKCFLSKIVLHLPTGLSCTLVQWWIGKLRQRQNYRPFVDAIFVDPFSSFKIIVFCIPIPLRFISHDPINTKPVLVQIMAWRRTSGCTRMATGSQQTKAYLQQTSFIRFGCMMTSKRYKKNPRYWPFVREIHRSPVNSPHQGQWRGALMFSLICDWITGWVNNHESGDLISHRAHYDVTVIV